jgi:hypothetical protein
LSYNENNDNPLKTFFNAFVNHFVVAFMAYWFIIALAAAIGLLLFNIQTTWITQNIQIIILLSFVVGLLIALISNLPKIIAISKN